MKSLFIKLIKFYQNNISVNKPPRCRFVPTCSEYAIGAIENFGVFIGSFLIIFRLLRCNPLFKGGYDPVPERKHVIRDTIKLIKNKIEGLK